MGKLAVLLVDDAPRVLRTTDLILSGAGYDVSTAAISGDAIRLLRAKHFDLVLLECLPDHRGVIQEAKRVDPNMRVAVLTGDDGIKDLPLVDLMLHKPVAPPVLLQKISVLLSSPKAA